MKLKNLVISISLGLMSAQSQANPSGAQVVNGQVTFSQPDTSTLLINNSNGSIINWQNFSINSGETTHFQQGSANSMVLNQVVGNNASEIYGTLSSNGQVFLINQHGILFGPGAVIDTAGFIASTLNLADEDFLNGRFNFESDNSADILNQGYIRAGADGDIALIAPNIVNEGVIEVEQGNIILAAGEKVSLASLDTTDVIFEVQSADNSVTNLGAVKTDGGAVGVFAGTLKHSGVIEANALALDENGNVVLVATADLTIEQDAVVSANGVNGGRVLIQSETGTTLVSGNISATGDGGQGGVIDVLGAQVGLIDAAVIDASGAQGGGDSHIGGNYQGKGHLQNAAATFVGQDVVIDANAIQSGNGGEVIVWADETARVHGTINATGGAESGNGGFVETSGKIYLDVTGIRLDLGADSGISGDWLLDPFSIQITTAADLSIGAAPDFSSTATGSNLNIATLITQLNAGTSVTIDTGVAGGEAGDILLDAALNVSGVTPVSLTLDAANDIILSGNASITSTNSALSLVMTADSAKNDVSDNLGAIDISSSIINTNGGNITLNAGSGISISEATTIQTDAGNVVMNTVTGNITLNAITGAASVQTTTGSISLQAQSTTSNITLQIGSVSSLLQSTTGNINLTADEINISGQIAATSGGVVTLRPWDVNTPIQLVTSDFILAGNLIIGSDELAIISGDLVIGSLAHASTIDINSPVVYSGGTNLALLTSGGINFNQTGGTAIDVGAGTINLQADKITDNSAALDLLASAIDMQTVNGAGAAFGGEIDLQTDALTFNNTTAGAIVISNSSATGLTVSGTNASADSGVSIQIDDNSLQTTLGNITGGANGDISITTFGGDLTLSAGAVISGGANATQHLLSASGVITFGVGSSVHNNSGTTEIAIDAADLNLDGGTVDAFNGKVWINPNSSFDIGIGDFTTVSAGMVVKDNELANISAAALGVGNLFTNINIGTVIDLSVLGYDLFLSAGGSLTFEAGSGINAGGGKLSLYSGNFDFTTNAPVIQGSGIIEFVNLLDGSPLQLDVDCLTQTGAVCVSQANLDSLVDGFSTIRFFVDPFSIGGVDVTTAMTFVDNVEIDTSATGGDININGSINLGTNNILINAGLGAINFNLSAATEIVANDVNLTAAAINQAANTVSNISSNTLSFYTGTGLGNVGSSSPFLLSVNEIVSGENLNPVYDIYIRNDTALLVTFLKQGAGIGLPVTLEVNGDLTVGQIDGGDANNSVILDTTAATNGIGGAILDNGAGSPNVTRAYRVELYSEAGIGSMTDWFEIGNVNDTNSAGGGLYASAVNSGDIFVDNVAGIANFFDIQAISTNTTGSVFIHNAVQPMNLNASITTVAGDITLESNSAIDLIASLNSGNGNVNVSVLSGSGNLTVGSGVLSNSTVNLSNSVGDILFGSTSFVMAPTVNLTAAGRVDDTGATNVVGGGSAVAQLNVNAGAGITLMGAANDASQVSLTTTSGNIDYTDINGFSLNGAYASNDGTATGIPSGDVNLYSGGAISDGNGAATDIVAVNAYVEAVTGIGAGDALDLNVSTLFTFANIISGDVNFNSISTANLDFYGYSDSATGFTSISHGGVLTIPAASPFVSPLIDLSISALQINIDGSVTGNNVILLTDELVMGGAGSITATNDVGIEIFSDATPIYFSTTDNAFALDISALEISQITAARLSIGVVGQPGTGFNSGNITFLEGIDTGTMDTRLITAGNIIFNQGGAVAFTNASIVGSEFNTQGAIVDQSAGVDIQATNLILVANNGIGDGNAVELQVTNLDLTNNTSGNIALTNAGALTLAAVTQAATLGDLSIINDASLTIPTINMTGGDVILASSSGQLLSDGSNPAITNAASVALNSATGIGTITNAFNIDQLGNGGLTATVSASGNMYINNVNTNAVDFNLAGLTINSGTAFIDNQDSSVVTRITGAVTGNGLATISSISEMQVDGSFNMSTTGGVDLTVSGTGNSIVVNDGAFVRSVTGDITMQAHTDIQLLGTADLRTSAPGIITLTASNGQVVADATATISGGANLNVAAQSAIALNNAANNVSQLTASVTTGNINFNTSGNLALDLVSVSNTNTINITAGGAITDANGVANNISGQTVSLNAANGIGTTADPLETAVANFLQFNNTTTGDVVITNSVANSVLLAGSNAGGNVEISFDNNIQLQAVTAGGDMVLTSVNGNIQDSNDGGTPVLNLTAANISLTALNHVGAGNPVEMQLSGTTGNITLANSSTTTGNFEIDNWAVNTTDVARLIATNTAIGGTLYFANQSGVTEVSSISTNGFVEIKSAEVRLNGSLTNNDAAGVTAIVFVTDEFDVTTGSIDAGLGDFSFETLTDGRLITLGAIDISNTSLDLVQADISAITSARISIGLLDTTNVIGSGDITVTGSLDMGARDTKIETYGDLIFANGAGNGLITTGLMQLNVDGAVVGEASTGNNIAATSLEILANTGIGSANAIRTQVADLSMLNNLLNNINVVNSGSLQLTDSASLTGSMSVSSTGVLTLTPNAGLAGTTGAVASTGLTLTGANGLNINGVVSAGNISLLSANGIVINDTVTTLGALVIDADTDGNFIGDLIFENTQGGTLTVSGNSLDLNAGNIALQATQGAVYVTSATGLNLSAANSLSILGGDIANADAYLSAAGDITVDVGNNVLISGGGALNTAASLFDVTGANANTLTMTVGGAVIMNGGIGDNSGAYITAGNLKMSISSDVTLTGSAAANSGALIRSVGGNTELYMTPGILTFTDGAGTGSLAQLRSNDGFGLLIIDYLSCVGCDAGLVYFASPVVNTATNEIIGTQNDSVIGTNSSISSTDTLAQSLEQASTETTATESTATSTTGGAASEEDENAVQEEAEPVKVLVCT